jgi:gas vesicle protein
MNWKMQTMLIGTVVGATAGALTALLMIKRAEQTQQAPRITTSDGVKIGMSAFSLARMISDLGIKKSSR